MSFLVKALKDKTICITGAGKGIGRALMDNLTRKTGI